MSKLLVALLLLQAQDDVELDVDRKPKTRTGGSCVIRNATILTASDRGALQGDLFIRNGKIAEIGPRLRVPGEIVQIDAKGLYLIPGIIDCHAHIAAQGGLNEGSESVTPEVWISDTLNPKDVAIYRALAGGTTAANVLHGSANTIGGQNAVIKLRYGTRRLLFEGAPRGIKFALGENVKQSNFHRMWGKRFPNTRMGVEATLRRAFLAAREYMERWDWWRRTKERPLPRFDLRLETLADILRGKILVHCHCYRADEILMILRVAKEFGFKIATLQHVLEGYKVAPEIAAAGVGASTFADWWAFKIEAYDATPYNAALMTRAGVVVSINSDSADHIRRLNLEAAKAMRYGGLSEEEALRLVTLNPAKQLRIDHRVGSIEVGKDADLALFQGHPLSASSRCVLTMIDGEVYFENRAAPDRSRPFRPVTASEPVRIPRAEALAFTNAEIHPVSAPAISRGTVLIRDGKVQAVGANVVIPDGVAVIDLRGKAIYPGFIDAETSLGLAEIGSVRGTRDEREIGKIQPDLLAASAVNAEGEHIPVARVSGITTALVVPEGGLIAGRSGLIRLSGWTTKEMILREVVALHVRLPRPKKKDPQTEELRALFRRARRYRPELGRDPRLEALGPFVSGRLPVIFRADTPREIRAAVAFAEGLGLRAVISGGRDAWRIAGYLAKKKIPVLLSVLQLPAQPYDPYDSAYFAAARLHAAGVPFAIRTGSSADVRQLSQHAAMAAAYGLPREEALKAITLAPARILGFEEEMGSLSPGKRANLVIVDGDPLEIASRVVGVLIDGVPLPLESRHTRLYRKYRRRIRERRSSRDY